MLEPLFEIFVKDMTTLGMLLEHSVKVTRIKRHGYLTVPVFDLDFSIREEAKRVIVKKATLFAFPASYKDNGYDYFRYDTKNRKISYLLESAERRLGLRT